MNTLQQVAITYTSHEGWNWPSGKGEEHITSIVIDDAPFTRDEALYMSPTANALARLICALEELHGRHLLGSDQILDIAKG